MRSIWPPRTGCTSSRQSLDPENGRAGLPPKIGVCAGIIAVSPGKFGIAVTSPLLDEAGNLARARNAIADITNAPGGNPLAVRPRQPQPQGRAKVANPDSFGNVKTVDPRQDLLADAGGQFPILAAARQPLDRRGVLPAVLDDGDSRPGHPRRRDYAGHEKLATRLGGHFTRSDENRQRQPDTEGIENTLIRTSDGNVIFSLGLFGDGISITDAKYQIFAADAGLKYRGCRSRASSTGARCRSCVVREPRCRRFCAVQ